MVRSQAIINWLSNIDWKGFIECEWMWSCSVASDSLLPHGLWPTRLLRTWDFPGKSTGVGCHCLLWKRSLVFPIVLFSSISLHWSLKKPFLSLLAFLWNSGFKWVYLSFSPLPLAFLLFSALCKASWDNHFAFLHFFFLGMVLINGPVQCHEPPSIVLQALWLSDLIPCIYFSLPPYSPKGFALGHTWMV